MTLNKFSPPTERDACPQKSSQTDDLGIFAKQTSEEAEDLVDKCPNLISHFTQVEKIC